MPGTIRRPDKTIIIRAKPQSCETIVIAKARGTIKLARPIRSRRPANAPTTPEAAKCQIGTMQQAATLDLKTAGTFPALEFHSLAEIFSLPADTELQAFADDIAARGLLEAITIFEGKILDGRSRYLACQRAGVVPRFESYLGNDPLGFVLSRNLHRRQLTERQRLLAAARAATLPVGANQTTPGLPIGRAAELFQVSERNIARVKMILRDGTAELIRAVESGKIAVSRAAELATSSTEAQIAALRDLAEGKPKPRKRALRKVSEEDNRLDQSDGVPSPRRNSEASGDHDRHEPKDLVGSPKRDPEIQDEQDDQREAKDLGRSPERGSEPPSGHDRRKPNESAQGDEVAYARLMEIWSQAPHSVQVRFYEEASRQIADKGKPGQ